MNKFLDDKKIKNFKILFFWKFKEPDLELNPGSNYVHNQEPIFLIIFFEKNTKTEG
jgi:hypothetical protein